jgi:hypothetical protein
VILSPANDDGSWCHDLVKTRVISGLSERYRSLRMRCRTNEADVEFRYCIDWRVLPILGMTVSSSDIDTDAPAQNGSPDTKDNTAISASVRFRHAKTSSTLTSLTMLASGTLLLTSILTNFTPYPAPSRDLQRHTPPLMRSVEPVDFPRRPIAVDTHQLYIHNNQHRRKQAQF